MGAEVPEGLTDAKDLPCEERLAVLRTAYTEGLAAQLGRVREVVADLRRAEEANTQLVALNNGLVAENRMLNRTMQQVVGVMLDTMPGKTFEFRVEDLLRLDGAELEAQEVDGRYVYHLKT